MEKFRDDKAWYECMTVPEVQEMKDVSTVIAEQSLTKFCVMGMRNFCECFRVLDLLNTYTGCYLHIFSLHDYCGRYLFLIHKFGDSSIIEIR